MTRSQRMRRQSKRMRRRNALAETYKDSEAQRVYGWRLCELKRAGMPPLLAMKVADSDFDLHRALAALDAGCTPETLADIAC